jgi:hypothetical protein
MPRKSKRNSKNKKGGGCGPKLDITRYTKPCASGNEMPLDNLFAKHFPQSAGGYSILPDVNIGNLPEVKGYSDCCPPVYTKNGPVWSNNFQPVCGQQGGNKKKRSTKRQTKSKRRSKSKVRHTKPKSKSHKSRKTKRHSSKKPRKRKRTNRKHKGGSVKGMSGVNSNFSSTMTDRTFGCKQPFWKPGCV